MGELMQDLEGWWAKLCETLSGDEGVAGELRGDGSEENRECLCYFGDEGPHRRGQRCGGSDGRYQIRKGVESENGCLDGGISQRFLWGG